MKQRNGLAAPGPQHATPPPPERLPSPALQPISAPTTWGTRQRIAEHLSKLDQESLDHLLDKVVPAPLSTAALATATEPSFASTTASVAALTPHRHRSPRHRPRHHLATTTANPTGDAHGQCAAVHRQVPPAAGLALAAVARHRAPAVLGARVLDDAREHRSHHHHGAGQR